MLLDVGLLDVVGWLVLTLFFMMFIVMFVSIFTDIIMRRSLSGFAKAIWILVIFLFPLIGILAYVLLRPAPNQEDIALPLHSQRGFTGRSSTEEIARADALLRQGVLNQDDFDRIKARALR